MSLPVLEKTWQFAVNQLITGPTNLIVHQMALFAIKQKLVGFATNPWESVYSCDGEVAGSVDDYATANSDRWDSASDVLFSGTSSRSWIVLKNANIAPNFQVLIEAGNTESMGGDGAERYMTLAVSPSDGFSGGSLTERPTADDEVVIRDGSASGGASGGIWLGNVSNPSDFRLHIMHSTDGQCTRGAIFRSGVGVTSFSFEKARTPNSAWITPWLASWRSDSMAMHAWTYANYNDTPSSHCLINGTKATLFMSTEGYGSAMLGQMNCFTANELTGEWPMTPIGLVCPTTTVRGRHGTIFDMYFGSTNNAGNHYPSDGSKLWVQWGHVIVPWNGTSMLTA